VAHHMHVCATWRGRMRTGFNAIVYASCASPCNTSRRAGAYLYLVSK
jgi:hypothetical protein